MLITDLIGAVWALLPEGLWWVLGVLTLVVTVALRAEAR
jgi:hypothetical protein